MKRLILAITLLFFAVGVCVYENSSIDGCYYEAKESIQKMSEEFEKKEFKEAEKSARDLEELWNKTEKQVFCVTNAESLDELGTSIAKLPLLAKEKSEEFLSEARVVEVMFEHLVDRNRYYIY